MAIDSAAKRFTMLVVAGSARPCLPLPTGSDLDLVSERFTALNLYGGFAATIGSIGASSGSRQRDRRCGLIARV